MSNAPMIPISTYRSTPEAENLVLEVVRSGQLAQGPKVERLEELCCEMAQTKHAVAVSNGTATLIAALLAHDIGPGDEVITSSFTFVATLNAILFTGAKAVFVDIDKDTYNLNPEEVAKAVNQNTKAIMPVHIFGQACDMTKIVQIASENNLAIIEDAAQAHGATWDSKAIGSFGTGSFSFYTTKNVGSGEGGVVTTNDDDIAKNIRLLRNQGMVERYKYERVGWNFRLTDLQAAIAIPQMEVLSDSNKARNETAQMYSEAFDSIESLTIPFVADLAGPVWHQYSLRATDEKSRDKIIESLHSQNIGAGVYYPRPVYDYPIFQSHDRVKITNDAVTREVCNTIFSIPVHHYLSDEEKSRVIEGVVNAAS